MVLEQRQSSGLAAEIRQTRPFSSVEVEAYLNLIRSADKMSDEVSALCKGEGVSQPQYNVLRILRGAGSRGLTCGGVSDRMVSRLPDASRLLDRMRDAGLIRKKSDKEDRRVVRVVLAAKGKRVLERLEQPLEGLHRRQFTSLDAEELATLNLLLAKARVRDERVPTEFG